MTAVVTTSVPMIEEALARSLNRGGFEIIHRDGERYLRPILTGILAEMIHEVPLLALTDVARDLERYLS